MPEASHDGAPVDSDAGVTVPLGNPPELMPVIVPEPLMVMDMAYTITQFWPVGMVTVMPELMLTGPALTALVELLKV